MIIVSTKTDEGCEFAITAAGCILRNVKEVSY